MKLGVVNLRFALKPFLFFYHLLFRIFWSGLNGRNAFQLVINFWINFSPVFIWLMIFKNAGLIPKNIRPHIYVKFAMRLDDYMFNIKDSFIGSVLTVFCLISGSWLLYLKFYSSKNSSLSAYTFHKTFGLNTTIESSLESSSSGNSSDLEEYNDFSAEISNSTYVAPGDFQDDSHHETLEFFETTAHSYTSAHTTSINKNILKHIQLTGSFRPLNCWYLSPPILCASCWFILNFNYWCKDEINTKKDLLAWFSYVIGHFCAPLFTAIWLYVFHAPGALKLFSFGLGLQNIAGVLTHLIFPNAPPWFIHYYGENKEPNYDMPGYAAGLARIDLALGTHIHSAGFHASPIVFGALPSLHSAMAVMVFFFICYYSRWTALKLLALIFVIWQWWATIYLDHHWRLDLIVGMFYSISSYTLLWKWKKGIKKVDHDFIKARLSFDFRNGSTMGMRVFRNTKFQKFFDPLV